MKHKNPSNIVLFLFSWFLYFKIGYRKLVRNLTFELVDMRDLFHIVDFVSITIKLVPRTRNSVFGFPLFMKLTIIILW